MITSLVSFRRGTGKTNIIVNLAYRMALRGYRVGIGDIDLSTPSAHVLFGLDDDNIDYYLNDYLCGDCDLEQAVIDLKEVFLLQRNGHSSDIGNGAIYLLAGEPSSEAIHRVMNECFSAEGLVDSLISFHESFKLDFLFVDTHAGINEYVLAGNSVSDLTMIVMHMDQQEYQGTAILIELMRKLSGSKTVIVINNPPETYAPDKIIKTVEDSFNQPVAAVLPHSKEMLSLGSRNIFSLIYPNHPYTSQIEKLVAYVLTMYDSESK